MGTKPEKKQYVVTTASGNNSDATQLPQIEIFNSDGTPFDAQQTVMTVTAAIGALTSAAAATNPPTKVEFDKVVVDLASIRTTVNDILTKLKSAGYMASS